MNFFPTTFIFFIEILQGDHLAVHFCQFGRSESGSRKKRRKYQEFHVFHEFQCSDGKQAQQWGNSS